MRIVLALLLMLLPGLAHAAPEEPAALCEWAAQQAAAESGVPADILGALTLTETGRRRDGITRPWAWSVNAEGAGSWFDDPGTALAFAEERVAAGRTNLDIGCFQLNYRWHGMHFGSVAEMFDPLTNARYAARFVSELHAEMGDWRRAAGAFHSRTPANAQRYLARFDELRIGLQAGGFGNLHDMAETYNQFASADPMAVAALPSRQVRIVEKRMILGAPLGTPVTGMPGSLAALGGKRVALLSTGTGLLDQNRGPLIGPGAAEVIVGKDRRRRRAPGGATDQGVPELSEEALAELVTDPAPLTEQAAIIPDAGSAPADLQLEGEEPL